MSKSTLAIVLLAVMAPGLRSETGSPGTMGVPVRMTVTANVDQGKRAPQIRKEDIFVKTSKGHLPVTEFVAAQGDRAGLELFILIDDSAVSSLGLQLDDLRAFIKARPQTTLVGIAYARNGIAEVRQELTNDHMLAARALRLPLGTVGAFGSPYLSATSLMKRWAESPNRHEIILISDGIDRAKRGHNALMNPDVDVAADVAQRTGTMIHTLYYPGAGHWQRNFWEAINGQNGLSKLSDITGGESFYLGRHAPVSFAPYLADLSNLFNNQYLLSFVAVPDKTSGFRYVKVSTEVAGVDFSLADAVWVPSAK